jgi:hypothetical protein
MKYTTIPQLEKQGGLRDVSFAIVNTDDDRELAGRLMRGGSIPQLVMYHKTADGWKREQLTGAQSPSSVQSFLAKAADQAGDKLSQRE